MQRAVLASRLMGMLVPFKPSLLPVPKGQAADRPKAIAPPPPRMAFTIPRYQLASEFITQWPVIDNAISWLRGQRILTPRQIDKLKSDVQVQTADGAALWADSLDKQIGDAIIKSQLSGETSLAWQDRVQQLITVSQSEAEAIARTFVHRSMNEGLNEVLDDPYVAEEFPYVLYMCTADGRSRASHVAMDGKVAKRGSALHAEMERLHNEWNCRCTIAPLSEEEAKEKGIDG